MTTHPVVQRGKRRLPSWALASMGAYLAVVGGLVATVLLMQVLSAGANGIFDVLVLAAVVLTLPLSTAYYVVGVLGSSQGLVPGEIALGALSLNAALYYLGFFLLAAINAAVFRLIVWGTRRRWSGSLQSDS